MHVNFLDTRPQVKQQFSDFSIRPTIRSTFGIDCGGFLMFLLQSL